MVAPQLSVYVGINQLTTAPQESLSLFTIISVGQFLNYW